MSQTVLVSQHPLVQHSLGILRHKQTNSESFRVALARIAGFLVQDATGDLPLQPVIIETPLCSMQAQQLQADLDILIVPILRAGLVFADVALQLIPQARVCHIGLYRDEATLQPVTYYNKLSLQPVSQAVRVLLLDPMLATGGSAVAAVSLLVDSGIPESDICLVCLIAAPEGIALLHQRFPRVRIVTASVDERLNEKGFIVPGLGDAGDRTFGTI